MSSMMFKKPVIPMPENPAAAEDPNDKETAKKLEEAAAAERTGRNGRSSTILTSGMGLGDEAKTSKKYLLGN